MAVGSACRKVTEQGVVHPGTVAGIGDDELGDGVDGHGRFLSLVVFGHAFDGKEDGVRVRPAMA
jgi:hypothetical protein